MDCVSWMVKPDDTLGDLMYHVSEDIWSKIPLKGDEPSTDVFIITVIDEPYPWNQ